MVTRDHALGEREKRGLSRVYLFFSLLPTPKRGEIQVTLCPKIGHLFLFTICFI
jgi:hypothetical protein